MTEQPWAQADHGILFMDRLVRAILAGEKTETRRLVGPHNSRCETASLRKDLRWDGTGWPDPSYQPAAAMVKIPSAIDDTVHRVWSRYEQGDTLWVRETHALEPTEGTGRVVYRADRAARYFDMKPPPGPVSDIFWMASTYKPERWRPSIHMPRWAARIRMEITAVGCERIQDVDDTGAFREGIIGAPMRDTDIDGDWYPGRPRARFRELWDEANGHRDGASWEANPFVWVIRFRVLEKP